MADEILKRGDRVVIERRSCVPAKGMFVGPSPGRPWVYVLRDTSLFTTAYSRTFVHLDRDYYATGHDAPRPEGWLPPAEFEVADVTDRDLDASTPEQRA